MTAIPTTESRFAPIVATFYKFVVLGDAATLRGELLELCRAHGLQGTVILAPEGINGTVAGAGHGIDALRERFRTDRRFDGMEWKVAAPPGPPFHRLKVQLKREIVTLRQPLAEPTRRVGTHVAPEDWNELIADPGVLLIDCRNDFEVQVGSFIGAVDPATTSFTDFPEFVRQHLDPQRDRRIAMFCTGGIRCEKASSYLMGLDFAEVLQLRGGILRYLRDVPEIESRFRGECFVFDRRVSVRHGLRPGSYRECHGCKRPVSASDRQSVRYEYGVSCPVCFATLDATDRDRRRERARQIRLAAARGELHLGRVDLATQINQ